MLPVIRASVTFLSGDKGGRDTMPGLSSGRYMPHLVIQPSDVRVAAAEDEYLGVRFLSVSGNAVPDRSLDCEIELMYFPIVNYDAVRQGATFTVREGGKVIGFGVVAARN